MNGKANNTALELTISNGSKILIDNQDFERLKDKYIGIRKNSKHYNYYTHKNSRQYSLAQYIMSNEVGNYRQNVPNNDFRRTNLVRMYKRNKNDIIYYSLRNCYMAFAKIDGKEKKVGHYLTEIEATIARDKFIDVYNLPLAKSGIKVENYDDIYANVKINKIRSKHNYQGKNLNLTKTASDFTGVCYNHDKRNGITKWMVTGTYKGRKRTFKRFPYTREGELRAAYCYNVIMKALYGKYAKLNELDVEFDEDYSDIIQRILNN